MCFFLFLGKIYFWVTKFFLIIIEELLIRIPIAGIFVSQEIYLGPAQTSMTEFFFCESCQWFLAIVIITKVLSSVLGRVLDTPLLTYHIITLRGLT